MSELTAQILKRGRNPADDLDVIRAVSDEVNMPIAAYNVSGEYAMIEAAAERGWIDRDRVVLETLIGIRRAGADIIISYHAPYACKLLAKRPGGS